MEGTRQEEKSGRIRKAYVYEICDDKGWKYAEIQTTEEVDDIGRDLKEDRRIRIFYMGIYMGFVYIPYNHSIKIVKQVGQI